MKKIIIVALALVALTSCKKKNAQNEATELKIKPKCLLVSNDGVRVRLFDNYNDYKTLSNPIRDVNSVGNDPVHFTGLEQKVYYFHLFKGAGSSMTSNSYCEDTPGHTPPEYYSTNGALTPSQVQELEIALCY